MAVQIPPAPYVLARLRRPRTPRQRRCRRLLLQYSLIADNRTVSQFTGRSSGHHFGGLDRDLSAVQ